MEVKVRAEFRALIPPALGEEFVQLEANLLKDGCRDPLVTWRGILLDGHNRLEICRRHGLPFKTVSVELPNAEAAMDWIDANQLGRRNLTPDQRSIIRGRRYNRMKKAVTNPKGLGGKRGKIDELQSDTQQRDTARAIAEKEGVSRSTVIRDGKRAEALEEYARSCPEGARLVLEGKKRFAEVRRELNRMKSQVALELPDSKYRVFYADPPWSYRDKCDDGGVQSAGGCERHYPTLSIEELCKLPIAGRAEDNAVLFLWVTSPLLFECGVVIGAWGFSYKASFVWDKVKHNMGHYNSVRHEFLLVCTRGSCTPDVPKLFDSVQVIERSTKHSQKPEEFRKIIETLYPHGKRLELFARERHKGWDAYGNEV